MILAARSFLFFMNCPDLRGLNDPEPVHCKNSGPSQYLAWVMNEHFEALKIPSLGEKNGQKDT